MSYRIKVLEEHVRVVTSSTMDTGRILDALDALDGERRRQALFDSGVVQSPLNRVSPLLARLAWLLVGLAAGAVVTLSALGL